MDPVKIKQEVGDLEVFFSRMPASEVSGAASSVTNHYYRQQGGGSNLGNGSLTLEQEKEVLFAVVGASHVSMDWTENRPNK